MVLVAASLVAVVLVTVPLIDVMVEIRLVTVVLLRVELLTIVPVALGLGVGMALVTELYPMSGRALRKSHIICGPSSISSDPVPVLKS